MITKCANNTCETVFRYFRGGKLFLVDPKAKGKVAVRCCDETQSLGGGVSLQYFWLCERCAQEMTIVSGGDENSVFVVSRSELSAGIFLTD
jgi:hypothetical protein